jgi:hypothetical protein
MLLFLHARRFDPDRPSGISPCPYLRAMFVFSVLCLVSRQCHNISTIVSTNDSSVLASRSLTLSPSASMPLTRLKSLQGSAVTPLAYKILCVRFTSVVHVCYSFPTMRNAVRQRRNTRYGWVVSPYERSSRSLSRPGLTPGKKHQASLGALTIWARPSWFEAWAHQLCSVYRYLVE